VRRAANGRAATSVDGYAGQLKYSVRVIVCSLAYFVFPACR
jgi:hypothetical protein